MKPNTSRIMISFAALEALDRMLQTTNDGSDGGKVSRSDLASWILSRFESHYMQKCLLQIRKDHFNQVAYLEFVLERLKEAQRTGKSTADIEELTSSIARVERKPRRRNLRKPPLVESPETSEPTGGDM